MTADGIGAAPEPHETENWGFNVRRVMAFVVQFQEIVI